MTGTLGTTIRTVEAYAPLPTRRRFSRMTWVRRSDSSEMLLQFGEQARVFLGERLAVGSSASAPTYRPGVSTKPCFLISSSVAALAKPGTGLKAHGHARGRTTTRAWARRRSAEGVDDAADVGRQVWIAPHVVGKASPSSQPVRRRSVRVSVVPKLRASMKSVSPLWPPGRLGQPFLMLRPDL